jgi:hypothetical protein
MTQALALAGTGGPAVSPGAGAAAAARIDPTAPPMAAADEGDAGQTAPDTLSEAQVAALRLACRVRRVAGPAGI